MRRAQPVVCLESEVRQVISNLVRNSMDAMWVSGGRLMVRSREATEWRSGKRGVLITVADTGGGMSRDTVERLYTAFFTTKGIGGTGLGLWVSSGIVQRHHGRLLVRSRQRSCDHRRWVERSFSSTCPTRGWKGRDGAIGRHLDSLDSRRIAWKRAGVDSLHRLGGEGGLA